MVKCSNSDNQNQRLNWDRHWISLFGKSIQAAADKLKKRAADCMKPRARLVEMDSGVGTVFLHTKPGEPYPIPQQAPEVTAEDICQNIARLLNLRPITLNLFALRLRNNSQEWLPPNYKFVADHPQTAALEFRLRFKLPLLSNLNRLDENAFNYLFHQVRHDLIHARICGLEKEAPVLGLCVMDMARAMEEEGLTSRDMDSRCKQFIPKEIWNKHLFFMKNRILDDLKAFRRKPRTIIFLKERYVSRVEDLVPTYLEEKFHAMVYREEKFPATIRINPFHPTLPGIAISNIGKSDWELLCGIDDLCFVSMRGDCTAEISRKTGIPISFSFKTNQQLASFVSLLDGYYRLSEKWTFNLCNDIQSPLLVKLRRLKCHGPVGEKFSYTKLANHPNSQKGSFILRQSSYKLDNFTLDFILEDKSHPYSRDIESKDGKFSLDGASNTFASVPELISYYMTNPSGQVVLRECIPPSDYDRSPLLICQTEKFVESSIKMEEAAGTAPHIISARSLLVYRGKRHVYQGKTCVVMKALWHGAKGKKVPVAIKFLKDQNDEKMVKQFLQMADHCVGWQCESLINLRGIVLGNPQALVFDWLQHGPLDTYLQENQLHVELVELIEAASHIAKAVWFLNDHGIVHGNIRAHNVLVAEQSDSGFTVKLADPSILEYQPTDLHWIPPEFMDLPLLASKFSTTDVWAMGTTLWEVLSYGAKPESSEQATPEIYKQKYMTGWRLPRPDRCPGEIYRLIAECWSYSSDTRKQPQALVRDIHQILYQFIGTKRAHTYASLSSSHTSQSQTNDAFDTSDNIMWTTFGSEPSVPAVFGSGGTQSTFVADHNHTGSSHSHCTQTTWLFEPFGSSPDLISTFDIYGGSIATNYSARGIYEFGKDQLSIKRLIGDGAYGVVFLGELCRSDGSLEHVAVKRMKELDNLPDHEELDDLQREFDILKKLCHPNIVEVKGVVYDPGVLLVMEYLPMGSLSSHFLTCHTKPSARQLMKFVQDVSDGMEYLSSNKIVHRDLAARNLLVANDESVKISDFGLARIMDNESNCYTIRTSRKLPIKWYPPECLEKAMFTEYSDVWSFGVTLYEIFSYGKEPNLPGMDDEMHKDSLLVFDALKKGLRLPIPETCPPIVYTELMLPCWQENATDRPTFSNLVGIVREVYAVFCTTN